MLRTIKPKNARSKRAMLAREPKEVEDSRTAIFVRGTHTGEKVNAVMKDMLALKKPNVISFSKKNDVRPFEDASSLEFWSQKNDASVFVLGQSTKKRPDGITFARTFDGRVLDMIEVGVDEFHGMNEFKTPKSTPGHKPLMHFASDLFETHPRFIELKSMLLSFFNGEEIDLLCLTGIEYVISVSLGPTPLSLASASMPVFAAQEEVDLNSLPKVHVRTYTIKLLASGTRIPRVELVPMGPSLDLSLRRHLTANEEMMKQALKRPKLRKQDVEKGLGKKQKNIEVDEMGDVRGRIHLSKQDLGRLQTRKMKGLKDRGAGSQVDEDGPGGDEGDENPRRKRRKTD